MKKMFLIPLITVCLSSAAQLPAPGTNQLNNHINKFEGTWQWVQGNDTIILKLKKYNAQFRDYSQDVIMGVHTYIRNGVPMDNALARFDSISLNKKKRTILLSAFPSTDTAKVDGTIKDLTKGKINNLHLQFVNGSPATIIWHLETAEGTFIDPNFQYGLTMPKDIVLTKQ